MPKTPHLKSHFLEKTYLRKIHRVRDEVPLAHSDQLLMKHQLFCKGNPDSPTSERPFLERYSPGMAEFPIQIPGYATTSSIAVGIHPDVSFLHVPNPLRQAYNVFLVPSNFTIQYLSS